jgi:hypothetical protein
VLEKGENDLEGDNISVHGERMGGGLISKKRT